MTIKICTFIRSADFKVKSLCTASTVAFSGEDFCVTQNKIVRWSRSLIS